MLVRLACTITSTGLWHRLTKSPDLDCSSLQPLGGVPETSQSQGSGLMYRNGLWQSLTMPPLQRCLTLILSLTVGRWQLEVHLQVPLTLGRREAMGDVVLHVLQSLTSSPSSSSVFQVGTLPDFFDQ